MDSTEQPARSNWSETQGSIRHHQRTRTRLPCALAAVKGARLRRIRDARSRVVSCEYAWPCAIPTGPGQPDLVCRYWTVRRLSGQSIIGRSRLSAAQSCFGRLCLVVARAHQIICGSVVGCDLVVVEHSGCYAACCSYLCGFRLGSDTGDDADEGHGEERSEFVEVGIGVELAGLLPVVQ